MAQNKTNGLLVDVDIESSSLARVSQEMESKTNSDKILTLTGGEDEVNSNLPTTSSQNIFDAIESISSYPGPGEEGGRQRERMNSVDSTNSIRSYDSTGGSSISIKCSDRLTERLFIIPRSWISPFRRSSPSRRELQLQLGTRTDTETEEVSEGREHPSHSRKSG